MVVLFMFYFDLFYLAKKRSLEKDNVWEDCYSKNIKMKRVELLVDESLNNFQSNTNIIGDDNICGNPVLLENEEIPDEVNSRITEFGQSTNLLEWFNDIDVMCNEQQVNKDKELIELEGTQVEEYFNNLKKYLNVPNNESIQKPTEKISPNYFLKDKKSFIQPIEFTPDFIALHQKLINQPKNKSIYKGSKTIITFQTQTIKNTFICPIVKHIETNYTFRFSFCICIFYKELRMQKVLDNYRKEKKEKIKVTVDSFLNNYIRDDILGIKYQIKLSLPNNFAFEEDLKSNQKKFLESHLNLFNLYLTNFCDKYQQIIMNFTRRFDIHRRTEFANLNLRKKIEIFLYDLKRFSEDKKYSIFLDLFPEIKIFVSYLESTVIFFTEYKQIVVIITFAIFKFLFWKENIKLELDSLKEDKDYLKSSILTRLLLNVRTLLYIIFSKGRIGNLCFYFGKPMLFRLFFNFLRVENPSIFKCFDFDEHLFNNMILEKNIENIIYLHYQQVSYDSESFNFHVIERFCLHYSQDFVSQTNLLMREFFKNTTCELLNDSDEMIETYKETKKQFFNYLLGV
ncbi:hypothetical protein TUBRATIS_17460 [Tubulinosema ratisbonensis]|uniref:Uncharacterized protein n=1 Tax=Tubulinosema ratisbonensis TaxID=291195 RepID=A0A437AL23_9MICR|nr:hypothetical protein TUBRATIS_17460 [Tubulinosema ratisbonensis]